MYCVSCFWDGRLQLPLAFSVRLFSVEQYFSKEKDGFKILFEILGDRILSWNISAEYYNNGPNRSHCQPCPVQRCQRSCWKVPYFFKKGRIWRTNRNFEDHSWQSQRWINSGWTSFKLVWLCCHGKKFSFFCVKYKVLLDNDCIRIKKDNFSEIVIETRKNSKFLRKSLVWKTIWMYRKKLHLKV